VPTRAPDTAELASRLRLAVTRLARRLRREAEAGISPSMLSALSSAERQGPLTMRDLCAAEQVQPPTMTRIVAALVAAGLVVREADAEDGRVTWVKVTPDGRKLLERSRRRKEAFLARALRALDARDVATLQAAADVLERFTEAPHEGERP
jgi:DNA-binding MarR family transcriptional regulator